MIEDSDVEECPFQDPKLNKAEVESVAALGCSIREVAGYFEVSEEIIREFYMPSVKVGWAKGKIKIRQAVEDRMAKEPRVFDFAVKHFIGGEGGKR